MWGSGVICSNNLSSPLTLRTTDSSICTLYTHTYKVLVNDTTFLRYQTLPPIPNTLWYQWYLFFFLFFLSFSIVLLCIGGIFYHATLVEVFINVCLWCNPINWNSLLWCLYRFIIERHKLNTHYFIWIRTCLWDLFSFTIMRGMFFFIGNLQVKAVEEYRKNYNIFIGSNGPRTTKLI